MELPQQIWNRHNRYGSRASLGSNKGKNNHRLGLHIAIVKNTFAIRKKSTKECLSFYCRGQKQNQIAKSEKFFSRSETKTE